MESEAQPPSSPDRPTAVKVLLRKPVPALGSNSSTRSLAADNVVNNNNNNISSTSTANLGVEQPGGLLRSSIDRGIGKLKDRSRSASADPSTPQRRDSQDSSNSSRRLSKFVPSVSRHRHRRRKKLTSNTVTTSDNSDGLDLNLASTAGSLTINDTVTRNLSSSNNNSSDSLDHDHSVASSVLTEDSDPDSSTRPPLVARPSHTGYLTLTSPLIASETVEPPEILPIDANETLESDKHEDLTDATHVTLLNQAESFSAIPTTNNNDKSNPETTQKQGILRKINVSSPIRTDTSTSTVETPSTLVTPPTPDRAEYSLPSAFPLFIPRSASPPTALHSFTHRRAKSAGSGPSKLSVASPLTPALEEIKTPGGSLVQPTSTGFFSSVFSATQNAVSSLSNTFSSSTGTIQKPRGQELDKTPDTGDETAVVTNTETETPDQIGSPAILEPTTATLGLGSLSLSHLGIIEPDLDKGMSSREEFQDDAAQIPPFVRQQSSSSERKETIDIGSEPMVDIQAIEKPVTEKASSIAADQSSVINRPKSAGSAVGSLPGDSTPPRSIRNETDGPSAHRSGSVRSRISDRRKRHRKNSNYSNSGPSAIGSALVASHSALVNPAATRSPRITGYTAANQKRNKDFHQLFRSVPQDDCLIEDYSAALQREILLHGRLYISERHICFSSNIMGWITNLVVSFDEVVALEKKYTAMIFPNAIVIQTLHAKNTFASLINRESTYELLLGIWRSQHPNLKATDTGHALDNSTSDSKPIDPDEATDDESEDEDDFGEDDGEETTAGSIIEGDPSLGGSDIDETAKTAVPRVASQATAHGPTANGAARSPMISDAVPGQENFPGPLTHPPTECSDQELHYDKQCLNDILPAPLGKVYSMLFGPLSGTTMRKFLEEQESSEIQYEDDKKGLGEGCKSYSYSFIKKLSGGIGPKQTKCIVAQTLDAFDLEKAVSVTCSTQTPDVPAGNAFVTKTKYCLMWGPNNSTRLVMNSTTEWSGKSFLRGAIDKGAEQGQQLYGKDLAAFLRSQLASKSPVKGSRKTKSRKRKAHGSPESTPGSTVESKSSTNQRPSRIAVLFEPVRTLLAPLGDLIGSFASPSAVFGVCLLLVTFVWLRQPHNIQNNLFNEYGFMASQRLAAYEELWRSEESELWNWLEDRINLDNVSPHAQQGIASVRQAIQERNIESRMGERSMSERQLKDAIQATEEKLDALKAVVERKKAFMHESR